MYFKTWLFFYAPGKGICPDPSAISLLLQVIALGWDSLCYHISISPAVFYVVFLSLLVQKVQLQSCSSSK